MRKNVLASLVGIMMLVGVTAVFACPGGKGHGKGGHGKGRGMHGMMDKLDLTAEQKAEIDKLHEEIQVDMEPLRERKRALRQQMHDLWTADTVDEDALIKLQREIATIELQMSELRIQMKVDMMEILTPEQREKFKALKKERKGKHGKRGKGKGKGCGGCPLQDADK